MIKMKKKKFNKKIILIILIAVLGIIALSYITYLILNDENKLSVDEKEWITENINVVQNISIPNNVDVFGKNGSGVFFDFLDDLEQEYSLETNPMTYNIGEDVEEKGFRLKYDYDEENDVLFYKEHYVIVSKEQVSINSLNGLTGKKIGILSEDEKTLTKYLNSVSNTIITTYETSTSLFEALENNVDIEYVVVPLQENLTSILTSDYYIDYHISDLNKYFVYEMKENDTFSSILKKYFAKWQEDNLNETIDENELETFTQALSISDKELADIQSKTYTYGFIDNSPYEILLSGSYGGIVSEYIGRFSAFSNTEFTYTKYKNFSKLTEAIANNKIDMFYNYYNLDTKYHKIDSLDNISFVVAIPKNNNLVINSISTLTDKTVYVLKNSLLEKYLTSLGGINVKTYEDEKDLKKIASKESIIFMDQSIYEYYSNSLLSEYSIRYSNTLSDTYNFYVKNNDTFNILFSKYIQTLDPNEIKISGIYNHSEVEKSGTVLGKVAKYSLVVLFLFLIILYIAYRSTKKIKIAKKIKKEDKMKYIDQLTSLKNRNYLNENIASWNKNTIYPQATIIIDLNQVQEINDRMGYEKGDAQIKAAANILIKTQLDNTDIMRTDGNEYLIYLVGYQEKQVASYIRKLYKEFKTLPYEHGASIGYSMILNDMKTIEDAINESVVDMRNKKEEQEEE